MAPTTLANGMMITPAAQATGDSSLFDCPNANIVVNDGNPIPCGATVEIFIDWIDHDGNRVTSGFEGLTSDVGADPQFQDNDGVRNRYLYTSPSNGPITESTVNFTWGEPGSLCEYSAVLEACPEVTGGGSSGDLASQREGYAEGITIPTNIVMVSNMADLKTQAGNPNLRVQLDPNFGPHTMQPNDQLSPGAGTMIDASLAPGAEFFLPNNVPKPHFAVSNFGGNIFYKVRIRGNYDPNTQVGGNGSAGIFMRNGDMYWVHKCTIKNIDDDPLAAGHRTMTTNMRATVTECDLFENSKYFLCDGNSVGGRVTFARNWIHGGGDDRAIDITQGAQGAHMYNNLVEDCTRGTSVTAVDASPDRPAVTRRSTLLCESNYYRNIGDGIALRATDHHAFTSLIDTDGLNELNGLGVTVSSGVDLTGNNPATGIVIPYSYQKNVSESVVKTIVGADS